MAIAEQLAELNTLRENLATAINGNGVDASTAEGLSSLVQKAGQVVEMYKGMIDASITEVYSTAETVGNPSTVTASALGTSGCLSRDLSETNVALSCLVA